MRVKSGSRDAHARLKAGYSSYIKLGYFAPERLTLFLKTPLDGAQLLVPMPLGSQRVT